MRKGWLLDAFIGLLLTGAASLCYLAPGAFPWIEGLELKSYDRRAELRQHLDPAAEIALIAIDDSSIASVGRWPWPRTRIASLLDKLAPAKPKVIGLDIVYSEPERSQGLAEILGFE